MTVFAITRWRSRSYSATASIASTGTKHGTATRASTRSIAIASACAERLPTIRTDGVRHALHAQTACGIIASLVSAHPRRAQSDFACALQRGLHDACLDLPAVY